MTAPDEVGLPEPHRSTVFDAVVEVLKRMTPEVPDEQKRHLLAEFLQVTAGRFGLDGLFETACACAQIIAGGTFRRHPNAEPFRYLGHGENERDTYPGTPGEYTRAQFVTAVINERRADAHQLFTALQPPDQPATDALLEFLSSVLRNAWSRVAGGTLMVRFEADKWPPVCDFCCGVTATTMFRIRGADVKMRHPNGAGELALRVDDMEYWYACPTCSYLVARPRPAWPDVWSRHRRHRPEADRRSVFVMYDLFQRMRLKVAPEPLPPERPQPTPGRI